MIHAGLFGEGAAARSQTLLAKSALARSLIGLAEKNNSDEFKHHVYKNKPGATRHRRQLGYCPVSRALRSRIAVTPSLSNIARGMDDTQSSRSSTASVRQAQFYRDQRMHASYLGHSLRSSRMSRLADDMSVDLHEY